MENLCILSPFLSEAKKPYNMYTSKINSAMNLEIYTLYQPLPQVTDKAKCHSDTLRLCAELALSNARIAG